MTPASETLGVLFGKAFLDAMAREDEETAMVFARAFLTQVPVPYPE